MKAEITSRRGTPIIYHGDPYSSDCDIELRETECDHPTCPNKVDSEQRGLINFPSYCIDIADEKHDAFYVCLPCAYRCGVVG